MGWTLSIVAVPVLYILSIGPLWYLVERGTIPEPIPKGLEVFYKPLAWIHDNTPLRRPLDAYVDWWINAALAASTPSAPAPSPPV